MTNKLYKKIKYLLKDNLIFVIMICLSLLSFVRFPFYINGSGGIVSLDKKIEIDGEYKSKGSFNMCYVSEYKANIYTLLYAYLNPNLDIIKKEEYINTGDTDSTMHYRETLELEESLDNAVKYGFSLAGYDIPLIKSDIYVTYIYSEANTDLEIGDKIIKVDDKDILVKSDINKIINKHKKGDLVKLNVINKNIEYERYAYINEMDDFKYIGIYLTEDNEYDIPKKIKFKFNKNESGPSGGVMLSLEIYNSLVSEDITKGYTIAGTGMITSDGTVIPVGGVKYKVRGAAKKAKVFFVPKDNYQEAIEEKEKNNYKLDIVSIEKVEDVLNYLKNM